MPWTQICCQYDGSFSGFLTCVFQCWSHREEPWEFRTFQDLPCSLYPLRTIQADEALARRVYRSLGERLGREGRQLVTRGFLSCLPERELWLWRFIRLGYRRGPVLLRDLTDPTVDTLFKAVRALNEEAHQFMGFVRFSQLDGLLAGEISPKNRVLPLLRPHFCARLPGECFVLHDRTHGEALFRRPGRWAILPVEDFQIGPAGEAELAFRQMWRSFYRTISIQGRYNPKCRQTHMPKRFWGDMTEFQSDEAALPP